MTAEEFRRLALALNDTVESAHMGHPDFRVNGRIFATLHADMKFGMVSLTPEQQEEFMRRDPAFAPENGAWGRQGSTRVTLADVDAEILGEALTIARRNAVAKGPTRARRAGRTR
jgi:YjbR